jgi:hypothetical protein
MERGDGQKKTCQYAVPPDWAQDKKMRVVHGTSQPFDQIKSMVVTMMKPVKKNRGSEQTLPARLQSELGGRYQPVGRGAGRWDCLHCAGEVGHAMQSRRLRSVRSTWALGEGKSTAGSSGFALNRDSQQAGRPVRNDESEPWSDSTLRSAAGSGGRLSPHKHHCPPRSSRAILGEHVADAFNLGAYGF